MELAQPMTKAPAQYEAVIGLEIHVQLATKSKMFCRCPNVAVAGSSKAEPNSSVCPVCLGLPGALPVANRVAVEWALKTAMALGCSIPEHSKFDRKQYFYPDLPKGYQISQYDQPLGGPGHFEFEAGEAGGTGTATDVNPEGGAVSPKLRRIGITRLHLEEDAGKLIHPTGADHSLVDLNRAGTPLMEIVTEPDLRTPAEAKRFLQELRLLMRYLGVSEAEMEKGHLRADANVSVRPPGQDKLGTKTELKNLNSFKFVEKGLVAEIARQIKELEGGGTIVQETRGFDEATGRTVSQRSKEEANDYRYFPEPDLPSLEPPGLNPAALRQAIPELPAAKRQRFASEYGLRPQQIEQLCGDVNTAAYFEHALASVPSEAPQATDTVAKLLLGPLTEHLKASDVVSFKDLPLSAESIGAIAGYVAVGSLDWSAAKRMIGEVIGGAAPAELLTRSEYQQAEQADVDGLVEQAIVGNPEAVADYKSGNPNAANVLVGAVMKQAKGSANPTIIKTAIIKKLEQ